MQPLSNDETVRSHREQCLKAFNSQFLATQAKKGAHLICMRLDI